MNLEASRCDFTKKEGTCQFSGLHFPHVYDMGGVYCPLHAPTELERRNYDCHELIKAAGKAGLRNYDGVFFPGGKEYEFVSGKGDNISIRNCTFEGEVTLNFRSAHSKSSIVLTKLKMAGRMIILPRGARIDARANTFTHELIVELDNSVPCDLLFDSSLFQQTVEIKGPVYGSWSFRSCTFQDLLKFEPGAIHSQIADSANMYFFPARFESKATPKSAEAAYRKIKEQFAKFGDRDNEGVFYALEKRSQRVGLNPGLTKWMSASYDGISEYGQNFTRPLLLLAALQGLAGVLYVTASPTLLWCPSPDPTIVSFTIGQVIKPFELLGKGALSDLVMAVAGERPSPWWALGTLVHSLTSLTLFAMFVLALRWRFKRS